MGEILSVIAILAFWVWYAICVERPYLRALEEGLASGKVLD